MRRAFLIAASMLLVSAIAAAQPLPKWNKQASEDPDVIREFSAENCPGPAGSTLSGPGAYDRGRRMWRCAATPTPGAGGGGTETCVTCTRSSATVYSCSGLSSIAKVRVGNTWNTIVATCGGLNQVTVSGSTVTGCYSFDAAMGPVRMTVQGCGS